MTATHVKTMPLRLDPALLREIAGLQHANDGRRRPPAGQPRRRHAREDAS